jgi:hypothetical protein
MNVGERYSEILIFYSNNLSIVHQNMISLFIDIASPFDVRNSTFKFRQISTPKKENTMEFSTDRTHTTLT